MNREEVNKLKAYFKKEKIAVTGNHQWGVIVNTILACGDGQYKFGVYRFRAYLMTNWQFRSLASWEQGLFATTINQLDEEFTYFHSGGVILPTTHLFPKDFVWS